MKQVIIMRSDLGMGKGKIACQACHASVDAALKASNETMKTWRNNGMPKIVLKVASQSALYDFIQQAKDADLITAVISDAGRTQLEPGTVTCGAIGPAEEEDIDRICRDLPLM